MRILLYPFFMVWLLAINVASAATMLIEAFQPSFPLLIATSLTAIILWQNQLQFRQELTITPLPAFNFNQELTGSARYSNAELEKMAYQRATRLTTAERLALLKKIHKNPMWPAEIAYWQNVLRQQPTDKNVLLNLSTLALFEGRLDDAAQLKAQAQQLDPNNLIFAQRQLPE